MLDPTQFGVAMAAIVKEAVAPLIKRIEELEAREIPEPEPVDLVLVANEVAKQLLSSERLETLADLKAVEAVEQYFESNPVQHGKDGDPGAAGKDGVGVVDAMIDRDGNLVAIFSDGHTKTLGHVIGKDGADFTDCSLDWDGERTLVIRSNGAELRKTLPIPLDRGYWREGMSAEKGDIYTHDGSAWIALEDSKTKPSHEAKTEWRMLARKGRDGRDGKDGKAPPDSVKLKGGKDG